MAWRDMTSEEMIAATNSLMTSQEVFNNNLMLSPLWPTLNAASDALASQRVREGKLTKEAQALGRQIEMKDIRRDACHRAAHGLLIAEREAARDEADAAAAQGALDVLYPDGLALNQLADVVQSGRERMMSATLDEALRAYLEGPRTSKLSALELIEEAIALGAAVTALDNARAQLRRATDETATSAAEVNALRMGWVRAMNALEMLLPICGLDVAAREALMQHVREQSKQAGERAAALREARRA